MRFVLVLFLSIFIISCSESNEQNSSIETPVILDLNNLSDDNISSIFDSIRYVLLEEDAQMPVVNVFKTIVTEKDVFVQDNSLHNIFRFDHFGRINSIIEPTGEGPTEFTQVTDYQIVGDTVIIRDNLLGKQISLNFEGQFIKQHSAKNNASNFYHGNDFNLYFLNGYSGSRNKEFLRISETGKESGFLDIDQNKSGGKVKLLHGFVQNEWSNQLSITLPHTYEIAFFDSSGIFQGNRKFEFLNIPVDDTQEQNYLQVKIINAFFPIENSYYMNVFFGMNGYQFLLNKNFEPTFIGKNLKNDLDGMNFYILPIAYHKNFALLYLHSTYIYNTYKHFESEIKENYPDAPIHQFVKDHESELTNDRHVLVFLRFKNA